MTLETPGQLLSVNTCLMWEEMRDTDFSSMFALGLSRETLKDNEMDMKFPADLPQLHANFPYSLNLDFTPSLHWA